MQEPARPGHIRIYSSTGLCAATVTTAETINSPSRRPRVVHMVEAFDKIGGPPKLVRQIIASPLQAKYDLHVLSYYFSGFNFPVAFYLADKLRKLAPDIVHIHGLASHGFLATLAAKLARIPSILMTIHGSTADGIAGFERPVMKLRRWIVSCILEPATLRLVTASYCVCDAMKNQPRIRKHAGPRLRDTIHNGIVVKQTLERNSHLRGSFGFSDDDIVLIYTGRMSLDKGLRFLASAMCLVALAPCAHAAVKLLLVGDRPEFESIRAEFQGLIAASHVVMTGRRDDVDELNAMADIFVFPSLHENLAFSLLEAMEAGIPVIATAVGGNPEVVVQGETGLLVPPGDPGALAQAILTLAGNGGLRAQMGRAGRKRLECFFSVDIMLSRIDDLYQSLLPAPRPSGS